MALPDKLKAVLHLPEAKVVNPELYEIFEKTMWPYLAAFIANMAGDSASAEKLQESLNLFFNVDHRSLDTYRAEEAFILPGRLKNATEVYWSPEENLRQVLKGEFLIVRIDNRVPWEFEVQVLKDTFSDTDDRRQFLVSPATFLGIRSKLVYVSSY